MPAGGTAARLAAGAAAEERARAAEEGMRRIADAAALEVHTGGVADALAELESLIQVSETNPIELIPRCPECLGRIDRPVQGHVSVPVPSPVPPCPKCGRGRDPRDHDRLCARCREGHPRQATPPVAEVGQAGTSDSPGELPSIQITPLDDPGGMTTPTVPAIPTVDELVELFRKRGKKGQPLPTALLKHMKTRDSEDFHAIASIVHGDGQASDDAIKKNVQRANELLIEFGSPISFRTAGGRVIKAISKE